MYREYTVATSEILFTDAFFSMCSALLSVYPRLFLRRCLIRINFKFYEAEEKITSQ